MRGYSIGEMGGKLRPVPGGPFRTKGEAGTRAVAFNDAIQYIKDTANTDMLFPQGRGRYTTPYPDITVRIIHRGPLCRVIVTAHVNNECVPAQNIKVEAEFTTTASCKEWADMMVRMFAIQINYSKFFMHPHKASEDAPVENGVNNA